MSEHDAQIAVSDAAKKKKKKKKTIAERLMPNLFGVSTADPASAPEKDKTPKSTADYFSRSIRSRKKP